MTTWRHKKRDKLYAVMTHEALMQCSAAPDVEEKFAGVKWTVYRGVENDGVYVRPTSEFLDGRFEKIEKKLSRVKLRDVKIGDVLFADGSFSCMVAGPHVVLGDARGLYVLCDDGRHYLDGQKSADDYLVGLTTIASHSDEATAGE